MSDENKQSSTALEELRRLKRTDRIKSLDIHEPELHGFNANDIFEIDEEPQKKKIFGKRSQRQVKINSTVFDDEIAEVEEIKPDTVIDTPLEKKVVVSEPVLKEEPVQEAEPEVVVQEPKVDDEPIVLLEEDIEALKDDMVAEDEAEEAEEVEDEDLYEEKKHFLFADYPKIEDYLQEKSMDGYHFVRREGKKYYFRKGNPKTYYYSMNYFFDEPEDEQWRQWENDGWKLVARDTGKKRSDAGWFTFRNEEEDGEYRKEIENEAEKYRFFRKYSSSCRSTMFLVFICMAICLVTGFLQYYFQGYLIFIGLCALLFLISFYVFLMYGRMLRRSKKRARMLKARLRLKESQRMQASKDFFDTSESEEELDTDWNTLENTKERTKRSRRDRS